MRKVDITNLLLSCHAWMPLRHIEVTEPLLAVSPGSKMTFCSDNDCDAWLYGSATDMFSRYIKGPEDRAFIHHFRLSLRKERRVLRSTHLYHGCRLPKV